MVSRRNHCECPFSFAAHDSAAALRELREESGVEASMLLPPFSLFTVTYKIDDKVKITLLDHWRKDGYIS